MRNQPLIPVATKTSSPGTLNITRTKISRNNPPENPYLATFTHAIGVGKTSIATYTYLHAASGRALARIGEHKSSGSGHPQIRVRAKRRTRLRIRHCRMNLNPIIFITINSANNMPALVPRGLSSHDNRSPEPKYMNHKNLKTVIRILLH